MHRCQHNRQAEGARVAHGLVGALPPGSHKLTWFCDIARARRTDRLQVRPPNSSARAQATFKSIMKPLASAAATHTRQSRLRQVERVEITAQPSDILFRAS
jgi:hypothetical protein